MALNVPYVGPIHPNGNDTDVVHPWQKRHARKYLISFVGSTKGTKQNALLRKLLKEACEHAADATTCNAAPARGTADNLERKWHSTFCLEPGGYSALRKSAIDSMLMQCIPVFFLRGNERAHLWPAHWANWRDEASVNIARDTKHTKYSA